MIELVEDETPIGILLSDLKNHRISYNEYQYRLVELEKERAGKPVFPANTLRRDWFDSGYMPGKGIASLFQRLKVWWKGKNVVSEKHLPVMDINVPVPKVEPLKEETQMLSNIVNKSTGELVPIAELLDYQMKTKYPGLYKNKHVLTPTDLTMPKDEVL